MKLLIFIHSLHSGGAERVTATLANHWAQKGWQVTVVTLTSDSQDFYQLHTAVLRVGLNVARESGNVVCAISNNIRRAHALRRVLKQIRPDVALSMMTTANILLAFASLGLKGFAKVGSERTYPPRIALGRIWEVLRSHSYGHLQAMVALTAESKTWLRTHTQVNRVVIIPNPVLWPLPVHAPILLPNARSSEIKTLLAVGRVSEEKGFALLIDIFQKIAPDFPDWRLVVLGDGPDRPVLMSRIADNDLSEKIFLPGRAGNVGDWYASAHLYVMSSRFEGFPNTLIEAMAHGLPAVSFDCDTGPRDIIRNEVDGLLVPAADFVALEAALRRLMCNDVLRRQFGIKAVEVRERFSMEKVIKMWENLFGELSYLK